MMNVAGINYEEDLKMNVGMHDEEKHDEEKFEPLNMWYAVESQY
jgi:hypothetical protein